MLCNYENQVETYCQVVVTHVPTQALEEEEKEELKNCESGVNSLFK